MFLISESSCDPSGVFWDHLGGPKPRLGTTGLKTKTAHTDVGTPAWGPKPQVGNHFSPLAATDVMQSKDNCLHPQELKYTQTLHTHTHTHSKF